MPTTRPAHPAPPAATKAPPKRTAPNALRGLANIGPAMQRDFELLGITTVAELARANADTLYLRLQTLTGSDQDPCVWDTFAAAIHQARTGEATRWWDWTPIRKEREAAGQFKRRP